jgi:serine/threonine-protein kinase
MTAADSGGGSVVDRLNAALEGRYRIERELGAGGMATVYLAQDLRHNRNVAIKVLKPELAAVVGADRFLAEIETTANLQHPHILPLFDSGEADSFLFYVMPLVEGETLRDRLDREKQLPVDETVEIVAAVAGALDYAHRHGVVHRDIKPANILLHDGQPVVADFGIALAVSHAGGGRLTETGLSLGTPHYMSPEQASAERDASPQSDIYSLACVAYEMLAGTPPFAAPSTQAVVVKILSEDPAPVSSLRKSVPDHVTWTIDRALQKIPADRFRSAGEFGAALRDRGTARATPSGAPGRAPGSAPSSWSARWVTAAAFAALGILAVAGWARSPSPDLSVVRLQLPGVSEVPGTIGQRTVDVRSDGRVVAYVSLTEDGSPALYTRDLGAFEPSMIHEGRITAVAFSPDGASLAFRDGSEVFLIPADGGVPRRIRSGYDQGGISWTSDGSIWMNDAEGNLVRFVSGVGSGELVVPRTPEGTYLYAPELLPSGDHAVVMISGGQAGGINRFGLLDLRDGSVTEWGRGIGVDVVGGDMLVWLEGGSLFAQRLDTRSLAPVGPVVPVPQTRDRAINSLAVSENGTLVYEARSDAGAALWRVDRSGQRQVLPYSADTRLGLRVSPDGRQVAFEEGWQNDASDVHVLDLETGVRTRLTFNNAAFYPSWTGDGRRVGYYKVVDGDYGLYWINADGSGSEEVLLQSPATEIEVVFVPGQDRILVRQGDRARVDSSDIYLYTIGDPDSGVPVAAGPGNEVSPVPSPDGRFVAYTSDETGRWEVFVRSLTNPGERWQVSTDGGTEPLWHPDGTEIYYRSETRLIAVPVDTREGFRRTGTPYPLFSTEGTIRNENHTTYGIAPDGESFLFASPGETETFVVLNWVGELRELLGEGR